MIICDPKSELYETTSQYLREQEYTVRVFNLVSPEHSDSWACLSEIKGDELMTQLFCDVIIKNTGDGRETTSGTAHEMNLLKALVLYVEQGSPCNERSRKNQNEDISFNQKQRKIWLGQENLETIAHTISVFRKGR